MMVKKNSVPMQLHSYARIVDDGLKSVPTVSEAIHLIKASQGICERACLRLHKIVSNKKEVLEAFPAEDHAKGIKELNLAVDPLPIERALGVMWCVESDNFRFRIELSDRPLTEEGCYQLSALFMISMDT